MQTDTIETTIEQLLATIRDLSHIIQVSIERGGIIKNDMREEFETTMNNHYNQY
jgi:hypothetical protein